MRFVLFAICTAGMILLSCGGPSLREHSVRAESQSLDYRTWTDASGQYRIEAVLVNYASGQVGLKKSDGNVVSVPLDRLSTADQQYVRSQLSRRRTVRPDRPPPPDGAPAEEPSQRAEAAHGDWPGWLGPARDGKSLDTGLLKEWPADGPRLIWKTDVLGKGFSNVSVVDVMVYTTGDVDGKLTVFAFDGEGNLKWKTPHDDAWTKNYPGSRSTPTIDGGRLYVESGHGLVGCYDAANGKKIWTRHLREFGGEPPNWGYAESVLIYGNLAVVTPGGKNCIVALDKKSGQPVWSSQGFTAAAQYGSCLPVEYQGARMIVAGTAEGIAAVDARNGRML